MATPKHTSAKRITRATVEQTKLPEGKAQQDIFDTVLPGFGLRIGKHKRSYFVMTRQLKGGVWKQVRVTLGGAAEMDLATARQQAAEAMERAKQGQDPGEVRSARQQALVKRSRDTYASVRDDFLKRYRTRSNRKPAPGTLAEIKRVLASKRFAEWETRPIAEVTRRDVLDIMDGLMDAGYEVAANRYLVYLKMLFGWALDRDIIKTNPTDRIKKPGAERSRERVLSLNDLIVIWKASTRAEAESQDIFASIVKLLMLTGQRRTEISAMRWAEIDEDAATLTLPPERTKNGREHVVPLSKPALAILKARRAEQTATNLETEFVFTSWGKAPFSGYSKGKAALDLAAPTEQPWTLHDLRRTMVTRMTDDLHIAPHIVEAVINHVSGHKSGVAGTYNRAQYSNERRRALDAWADYLMRHVGDIEADNVIQLTASTAI